jgi:hypothetical protein
MKIFVSYAAEDRDTAECIHLALIAAGHHTFFDRANLPPGQGYHERIRAAIEQSDAMVFLASPDSMTPGSYALTELKYARGKWHHPDRRVIPVRLRGLSWDAIPNYLKAVTVLEPEGDPAAEVALVISELQRDLGAKPKTMKGRLAAVAALVAIIAVFVGNVDKIWFTDWDLERLISLISQKKRSEIQTNAIDNLYHYGISKFKFESSPELINSQLTFPDENLNWNNLLIADEYKTVEARYFYRPLSEFSELPFQDLYHQCDHDGSYLLFMFANKKLFNISLRLSKECPANRHVIEQIASIYGLSLIPSGNELKFQYKGENMHLSGVSSSNWFTVIDWSLADSAYPPP